MRLAIKFKKQKNIRDLIGLKIIIEDIKDCLICLECGFKNLNSNIKILRNNSWKCLNCTKKNKLIEISKSSTYYLDLNKLKKIIITKLDEFKITYEDNDNIIILIFEDKKIPLYLNDFIFNVSLKQQALEKKSIVIFVNDSLLKTSSIYEIPKILSINEFVNLNEESFLELIDSIETDVSFEKYSIIQKDLLNFQKEKGWKLFEIKLKDLFNKISRNEKKIKEVLNYFKYNLKNPTGSKFVVIGGNYRVDIRPIVIFDYLNKLLEIDSIKGYEAKCYSGNLTEDVYDKKTKNNPGVPTMFVTNTNVSPKLWENIFKAKDNRGEWWNIIVDNDLLITLIIAFEYDDFFKI